MLSDSLPEISVSSSAYSNYPWMLTPVTPCFPVFIEEVYPVARKQVHVVGKSNGGELLELDMHPSTSIRLVHASRGCDVKKIYICLDNDHWVPICQKRVTHFASIVNNMLLGMREVDFGYAQSVMRNGISISFSKLMNLACSRIG